MIRSCCLNIIHQVFLSGEVSRVQTLSTCQQASGKFQDFVKMLGGKCSSNPILDFYWEDQFICSRRGETIGTKFWIAIYVVDKLFVQN